MGKEFRVTGIRVFVKYSNELASPFYIRAQSVSTIDLVGTTATRRYSLSLTQGGRKSVLY